MEIQVVLSADDIVRGLKHYRRIAKQDVLRAPETQDPQAFTEHAEARREMYAELADIAERSGPQEAVKVALTRYEQLPQTIEDDNPDHVTLRGQENALENFFLMIGLEPTVRRAVRSRRPSPRTPNANGDAALRL
jgi:hypothetical protein